MNIFQKFIRSMYDFKSYNDLIKEPLKKAIKYFFILTITFGVISTAVTVLLFYSFMNIISDNVVDNLPNFELEDGILSVDSEKPIIIDEGEFIFVIDTKDNVDISKFDKAEYGFAFLKDRISIIIGTGKNVDLMYKEAQGLTITKAGLLTFLKYIKYVGLLLFIPFVILFILSKIFGSLLFSLLVYLISLYLKAKLIYKEIYIITIYAYTVPIIISSILSATGIYIPFISFVYAGITGAIAYMAIGIIKRENEEKLGKVSLIKQ